MRVLRTRCIVLDPTEIINPNCRTEVVNRTYAAGHVYLFVTKPYYNVTLHFQLFKKTDVKYRPFLVNVKEDYCSFFKKNHGSVYMRLLYQMYGPYSNLNHSCPYEGEVIIKDFPMDASILPSIWPTGEYRFDAHIYNLDVKKITIEFTFELKELRNRPILK
ncbi:uncharacterized protein LOC129950438 [Eupeodes corollae]|uniref:uncharacterized protein LOC129950438 n=1 Tax=Eupeodes corollae TaxID=290404 RepID=UPI0024935357|nr:uncharacterized protein LOC129950438 [Eupeodes corollae]